MRIQSNFNNKNDVKFKAVYAQDPGMYKKLGSLLFCVGDLRKGKNSLTASNAYKNEAKYIRQMMPKYDSLLLKKGVTKKNDFSTFPDIFLTEQEEQLLEKINNNIDEAYGYHNVEETQQHVNEFLKTIGEIIRDAKPVSSEIINKSVQKYDSVMELLSGRIGKDIFNG